MFVYNVLNRLSDLMGGIGLIITDTAVELNQVAIFRSWLVPWLVVWADQFLDGRILFAEFANGWLEVYNWISDNLNINALLSLLTNYVNDVIDFFDDPIYLIRREIIRRYPILRDLFDDPISFVLEIIFQHTNIPYEFIYDPIGWVRQKILEIIGDLQDLINDPAGWVLSWLGQSFPAIYDLIYNPSVWIVDRLSEFSPVIYLLFNDPVGYIFRTVIESIEDSIEENFERFARIGERILNRIF